MLVAGGGAQIMRNRFFALFLAVLGISLSCPVAAQTVTFDFDTGTPALFIGQGLPLDQTSLGITAHFSSPLGSGFSVQTDATTTYRLSQFSGHYLWPNGLDTRFLDIQFSQQLTSITLTFATADFQQVEVPTTIQLTAYVDSTGTAAVGSVTAHGAYAGDTMPMGTLTFSSSVPFNVVRLEIPYQAQAASGFLIDNITVATVPPQPSKPRKHLRRLTG
jgi:hypothetical protein